MPALFTYGSDFYCYIRVNYYRHFTAYICCTCGGFYKFVERTLE